jgi:hypothetical protein
LVSLPSAQLYTAWVSDRKTKHSEFYSALRQDWIHGEVLPETEYCMSTG